MKMETTKITVMYVLQLLQSAFYMYMCIIVATSKTKISQMVDDTHDNYLDEIYHAFD